MLCATKSLKKLNVREISKYVDKDKTSKAIRQKFLDYFVNDHNHNFVRSSPVVPFCDPTLAFVNAGMNQFKGIFTGRQEPKHKKVANSQKCVRVGGKHNDLNVVGMDGYHHTFFEMLGNWSFGDYYKKEACELAWNLLTKEYKIPPSRLYVTYFKGDSNLELEEDVETREIWKSIGVPENRILPFSSKENFWEMSSTGPCGPCTEIHVDHTPARNRAAFVNKGLHDLTELWNIVFIQYYRDGRSIDKLPQKHVDTGMGFERLTAVLQGKISNYDTDNFSYLFKAIHKNCNDLPEYQGHFGEMDWNSLDTSYRILSDHVRMITVCLADGMIPEQNQKLRRIMRKTFLLGETAFKKDRGLVKELSNYVIENLGPVYSELERNVKQIHQMIDYEEDVYKSIRKEASEDWEKLVENDAKLQELDVVETPSLISAYKELKSTNPKCIDSKLAFKLYDTFGLDEELIAKLGEALDLKFNPDDLEQELAKARSKSSGELHFLSNTVIYDKLHKAKVKKTENSGRYDYCKKGDEYQFESVNVKVLKCLRNLDVVKELDAGVYGSLVLDKSNLYTESGGQISDRGTIQFGDDVFEVMETQNCDGYILHKGFLHSSKEGTVVKPNTEGVLRINPEFRLENMRNHTAAHLLNAVLKELKGTTCQKSSQVTDKYFKLDVGIFGEKITFADICKIEKRINDMIQRKLPVSISKIDSQQLSGLDYVTLIPGEIYPDTGIRLIEIKGHDGLISREPCCGTHVVNTSDIKDFCIIGCKSLGRTTTSIHAVTGDRAKTARANGAEIVDNIEQFEKSIRDNIDKPEILNMAVTALKQKLNFEVCDSSILPIVVKQHCLDTLNRISKQIKDSAKGTLKEFIEIEMQNAIESNVAMTKSNQKYMVHYLRTSMVLDSVPLQRATKLCPDIPVLVISYSDSMVKARCCVPKDLRSKEFNAETWLRETVAAIFKSNAAPPKGQDGGLVCNMRAKKVNIQDWDPLLQESLAAAKKYVEEHL